MKNIFLLLLVSSNFSVNRYHIIAAPAIKRANPVINIRLIHGFHFFFIPSISLSFQYNNTNIRCLNIKFAAPVLNFLTFLFTWLKLLTGNKFIKKDFTPCHVPVKQILNQSFKNHTAVVTLVLKY